eukprot:CAMPEP_0198119930 /NCGR_PEP_ID=MMETSP1442-20131203/27445_1 /TAXON_ID= /ORGANISM="Craspedostauros australis, Strain CCMP3328" /LENGTH=117 /DNA_ID=CAMNT_0043778489 /DNA_START=37 /DNA_END=391 /DNA_ORIENTATION=+
MMDPPIWWTDDASRSTPQATNAWYHLPAERNHRAEPHASIQTEAVGQRLVRGRHGIIRIENVQRRAATILAEIHPPVVGLQHAASAEWIQQRQLRRLRCTCRCIGAETANGDADEMQ